MLSLRIGRWLGILALWSALAACSRGTPSTPSPQPSPSSTAQAAAPTAAETWPIFTPDAWPTVQGPEDPDLWRRWFEATDSAWSGEVEWWIGEAPADMPIPLPDGRILGVHVTRHPEYQNTEAYLLLPATEIAAWQARWSAAGWRTEGLPPWAPMPEEQGGFVPGPPEMPPITFLCHGDDTQQWAEVMLVQPPHDAENLLVVVRYSQTDDPAGSPCADERAFMAPGPAGTPVDPFQLLPRLTPPEDVFMEGGSGGGSLFTVYQVTRFESDRPLDDLFAHFAAQIREQGWEERLQRSAADAAWGMWTKAQDDGDLRLILALHKGADGKVTARLVLVLKPFEQLRADKWFAPAATPVQIRWHGRTEDVDLLRDLLAARAVFRMEHQAHFYLGQAAGPWEGWTWPEAQVLGTEDNIQLKDGAPVMALLYLFSPQDKAQVLAALDQVAAQHQWQRNDFVEKNGGYWDPLQIWDIEDTPPAVRVYCHPESQEMRQFMVRPFQDGWLIEGTHEEGPLAGDCAAQQGAAGPEPPPQPAPPRLPLPPGRTYERMIGFDLNEPSTFFFMRARSQEVQAWLEQAAAALETNGWQDVRLTWDDAGHLVAETSVEGTPYTLELWVLPLEDDWWTLEVRVQGPFPFLLGGGWP
ncbi:MAG: hypothetical protein GXO37_00250 [Chloroflexi bacterium]|nr:hypothetical protein [Chloroflexota bacterium]